MRIVHVTNSGEIGTPGIVRQAIYLAMAQQARGSDVTIIVDRPGKFIDTCSQQGMEVVVADVLNAGDRAAGSNFALQKDAAQKLIKLLRSLDAGLIHCHTPRVAAQMIPLGNEMNIPCVFMADGTQPVAIARKMGLRFATICMSQANFNEMKGDSGDVYYIPNGTMTMELAATRGASTDQPVSLILVGSLIHRKGMDIAILAMAALRQRLGEACPVLNIYGEGNQKDYLAEMVSVLELGDLVQFHGFEEDILERCSRTDILVVSSRMEVGPLVALEAMSRGMPIVGTDVGEVANMLPDRRYGRVAERNSIMALANAIEHVLEDVANGHFSPDLLIKRHRELYSAEKMAERMEVVYDRLVANSATA